MATEQGGVGKIRHLRVSDGSWQWGGPGDQIFTHVIVVLEGVDRAFGITLKAGDPGLPSGLAMLSVLRDAYIHGLTVSLTGQFEDGKKNGILDRVDIGTDVA